MSRGLFTTPEERDALAGEYVLGTLDAATAARVTAALSSDSGLREAVAEWEARLAPPAPDPADRSSHGGWERREVPPTLVMQPARPVRRTSRQFWRFWAITASGVATVLAIALLLPGLPETISQGVLLADRAETAWLARVDHDGALHLTRVAPTDAPPRAGGPAAPDERMLQVWALPAGEGLATSLGLMARGATRLTLVHPPVTLAPGMLIVLTLEPPEGAPGGRPSGPTVFSGRLTGTAGN